MKSLLPPVLLWGRVRKDRDDSISMDRIQKQLFLPYNPEEGLTAAFYSSVTTISTDLTHWGTVADADRILRLFDNLLWGLPALRVLQLVAHDAEDANYYRTGGLPATWLHERFANIIKPDHWTHNRLQWFIFSSFSNVGYFQIQLVIAMLARLPELRDLCIDIPTGGLMPVDNEAPERSATEVLSSFLPNWPHLISLKLGWMRPELLAALLTRSTRLKTLYLRSAMIRVDPKGKDVSGLVDPAVLSRLQTLHTLRTLIVNTGDRSEETTVPFSAALSLLLELPTLTLVRIGQKALDRARATAATTKTAPISLPPPVVFPPNIQTLELFHQGGLSQDMRDERWYQELAENIKAKREAGQLRALRTIMIILPKLDLGEFTRADFRPLVEVAEASRFRFIRVNLESRHVW